MQASITIVTISYNQDRFLEDCIRSVISQGYDNLEYIVVDPGSTDDSREIIRRYSDKISRTVFESDSGPADGLNKGFGYATGDVLGYINSDDVYLPHAFETVARHFSDNPTVDAIFGNGFEIDALGRVARKIFSSSWSLRRYLFGGCAVVQQATFFRRSAFSRTRGFNVMNGTCWDGELLVDLARAGAVLERVPYFLGGFRKYPESISGSRRLEAQYRADQERIFRKAVGRDPAGYDGVLRCCYRFGKWLHDPGAAAHGVAARVRCRDG